MINAVVLFILQISMNAAKEMADANKCVVTQSVVITANVEQDMRGIQQHIMAAKVRIIDLFGYCDVI